MPFSVVSPARGPEGARWAFCCCSSAGTPAGVHCCRPSADLRPVAVATLRPFGRFCNFCRYVADLVARYRPGALLGHLRSSTSVRRLRTCGPWGLLAALEGAPLRSFWPPGRLNSCAQAAYLRPALSLGLIHVYVCVSASIQGSSKQQPPSEKKSTRKYIYIYIIR